MQSKRLRIFIFSGLALTIALTAAIALGAAALRTQAKGASIVTASYKGTAAQRKVLATSQKWGVFPKAPIANAKDPRNIPYHQVPSLRKPIIGAPQHAPTTTGLPLSEGNLATNFDGISDAQQKAINGGHVTPPDQGLCVGYLNYAPFNGKVVIELVNDVVGIYSLSGTQITAFPITTGFADPNAFSDPRCYYDTGASSFYMSVISCATCATDTFDDVLVVNSNGHFTNYQFSTSVGGTCFGDQPHLGYDTNTIYVTTDEFCGANYNGALVVAVTKEDLVEQFVSAGEPEAVTFGPVSLGGVPILTLQPAYGNASSTEYLLNSFPFDQYGNNNSVSNSLGYWTVTGAQNIGDTGGPVTLTGTIINSEQYAFPVPAKSTGDGSTPSGSPAFVEKEPFLNPDDDRMLQTQVVYDENQGVQIYAALDTAISFAGDPTNYDGVAWFVINPATMSVSSQGYVAVQHNYLLYPAITHSLERTTVITFTITGPFTNPAAGYIVKTSSSTAFGPPKVAAFGSNPHYSFSDKLFGRARWGDYSAAVLDPNAIDIWAATEYIGPPPGGNDKIDNWGTRVINVTGDYNP